MKISFIITWSSTVSTYGGRTVEHPYKPDPVQDEKLYKTTVNLIESISNINLNKEIILVDNSGDFNYTNKFLTVLKGPQIWTDSDTMPDWLLKVKDLDNLDKKDNLGIKLFDPHRNQAAFTSLAYQMGLEYSSGDVVVMQHNDTVYLKNFYDPTELISDISALIVKQGYSYVTVDKKHKKDSKNEIQEELDYFADLYWFMCKRDFYDRNNIYIDWIRGDSNHLATIHCYKNNLKFLHLPGFYEDKSLYYKPEVLDRYFPVLSKMRANIHTFNDIPFLLHYKGGTGLNSISIYDSSL
tara:strand:- start:3394 stop:4281 length:888 start_codon:yes stop_codon:yes gene_type:complete